MDGSLRPDRLRRAAADLLAADIIRTTEENRLDALALLNGPAEAGAEVTTGKSLTLLTNRTLANITDTASRFAAVEAGANKTETRTAAAITGQGALATLSAAAWTSQVSGRPVELTDGRVAGSLRSDKTYADPSLFQKSAVRKETTAFVGQGTTNNTWTTVDSFTRKLSPGTTKFLCTLFCLVTPSGASAWEGRARIKIGAALSAEVVVTDPSTSENAAVEVTGLTGDTVVTVEVQAIRVLSIGGPPLITARFTQTTPADDDTSHWST